MFVLEPLFVIKYEYLITFCTKLSKYKYFNKGYGYHRYYQYAYNNHKIYYNDKDNLITNCEGYDFGLPELLRLGFTENQIKDGHM